MAFGHMTPRRVICSISWSAPVLKALDLYIDGLMVKFSDGERQRSRSSVVNSILTRELKRLGFDPYPKEGSK
jgi:hypothetical protein